MAVASFVRSAASGSTDTFPVPFPYLDKSHVKVKVDGVLLDQTAYTWPTDGSIKITAGSPTAGAIVERRRETPTDPLTTFQPGNLDVTDLNTASLQPLYLAQEADDDAQDVLTRGWVTKDLGAGGTIQKGVVNQFAQFDAAGNIVPTSVVVDPATGAGLMLKGVYDPTSKNADAFAMGNMSGAVTEAQLGAGAVSDAKVKTPSALNRRIIETLSPFDPTYGAQGGTANDQSAIQAVWDAGAASTSLVSMSRAMRSGGQLTLEDNLTVWWANGAWLKQTGYSTTGSFIQNLEPNSSSADSIVNNITLINPQLDGSLFPDPVQLTVVSSTANTVTFDAAASAVDDAYNGLLAEDMQGNNGGGLRAVTDYVGATKTATLSAPWSSNPVAGNKLNLGWNDNHIGVAAGTSKFDILGGYLKNVSGAKQVPAGTGGKGINGEQGVTNLSVIGTTFEGVYNPLFAQGVDGVYANGSKKRAIVRWSNIYAKDGGSLLTVAGINTSADPDGDSDDSMVIGSNIEYENFGHSPYRIVGTDQQKSGIINFLEAQNVSLSNIRGRNDSTYPATSPGYPTDFAARCGFGLTGSIGAMIWGWGRNLKITDFVHHGNVDNIIVVRRARALGDDAGGGAEPGKPQNCFDWDFRGIKHYGVVNEYVIRVDPTAGWRVDNTELTGQIEVSVNGGFVTGGLVDPNMAGYTAITLTIHDHTGGKTVIGTPAQIFAAGNAFTSFGAGTTDLRKVDRRLGSTSTHKVLSLADDTATSWDVPSGCTSFELDVYLGSSSARGKLAYVNGAWSILYQPSTLLETSTAALTGTTGTDTKVTFGFNGGKIYVENRIGSTYTPVIVPKYYG